MKRIYSIVLLGAVAMSVTSCFDMGKKIKKLLNFGDEAAKEVVVEGVGADEAVEAVVAEEVVELVEEASNEPRLFSNSYDGYTNIRRSPSSKSAILGELRNGDEYVVLIGEKGNWYEVEYYDEIGYVHKDYVSAIPSKPVTVKVDAKWLEGAWTDEGYVYRVIFSNGKYALQQQYSTMGYGKWHLEGNEIVCTLKHVTEYGRELSCNRGDEERFVINESRRQLDNMSKSRMITQDEVEEGYEGITKDLFNSLKKAANQYVK